MNPQSIAQYGAIRELIANNVQTIGTLIARSDHLKELASQLSETCQPQKNAIMNEARALDDSIINLLQQIDRLSDTYNDFVKNAFAH